MAATRLGILKERVSWRKPRPSNQPRRSTDLTPEEQDNVRAALRFLAKRHGDMTQLAKAMGAHRETVQRPVRGGVVTAGIALRAARIAGVPLEDVLVGRFPAAGACPHCGRM
jgi:hypothetical protein